MTMKINVYRMSGAGNLFSVIDNREYGFTPEQGKNLAPLLCNINEFNGFASEGLLIIGKSDVEDFETLFYNPDGSSGMMCGNGGRCALDFAVKNGIVDGKSGGYSFVMAGNVYSGCLSEFGIKLFMPPPEIIEYPKTVEIEGRILTGTYVNVGSDHFVINHDQLNDISFEKTAIAKFAPKLRYHPEFGGRGANINVYRIEEGKAHLFTYERGVESVTGACGTGAVSTALHCASNGESDMPVHIIPPSGIPVKVAIIGELKTGIEKVILEGHSEITGKDIVELTI